MSLIPTLGRALAAVAALCAPTLASAGSPGLDALDEFRNGRGEPPAIQNRFFTKAERFELAPMLGYVPNNPFSKRYVGGVALGYHFTETLSAQGMVSYSPDLGEGDMKQLTRAAVEIAHGGTGGDNFQQPLDKVMLGATFGIQWAPLYGKINLVGESVLNFDIYGTAGLGMMSKKNYYAVFDESAPRTAKDKVNLEVAPQPNEFELAPTIGLGTNFFLSQSVALKLDTRFQFYIDNKPQYDDVPVTEQQLYNNFVASLGMSFFFPQMKPRLWNF